MLLELVARVEELAPESFLEWLSARHYRKSRPAQNPRPRTPLTHTQPPLRTFHRCIWRLANVSLCYLLLQLEGGAAAQVESRHDQRVVRRVDHDVRGETESPCSALPGQGLLRCRAVKA